MYENGGQSDYRRLPQDTAGSPDIGVFNGIYHIITWNRHYIIKNLHGAVIDAYETLVGLMNSAEVQHMKDIMILILIMLTISPTTAECERGFSSVNNIKTTARTSMKQEALSSLVRIKVDGPDLMEYNPTESIINWLNSGKGTRHIKGHICTGPRGPKAAAPHSDADD